VVAAHTKNGTTTLRANDHEVAIPADPAEDGPGWWSLRQLQARAAGNAIRLHLDDIDPFRDLADPVPPQRLSGVMVDRWRSLLDGAWQILTSCMPATAAAMSVGLRSIAPLPDSDDGSTRSASTGDGFGAVLVTRPPDALAMAEMLVHEFQHTKLGGLMHLTDLVHDDGVECHYAPWREDARPLAGLAQGVYAFLGITAFWRSRCQAKPELADQFEYAYNRRQTWTALYTLSRSTALTELGERFVAAMVDRLRPWMSEPVDLYASRASWYVLADHRIGWRIRNLSSDSTRADALATSWSAANPAVSPPDSLAVAPEPRPWSQHRLRLWRTQAGAAGRFRALRGAERDPDWDLVAGETASALQGYRSRVKFNVEDDDAWAGLGLSCVAAGRNLPWRVMLRQPELVKAVCRRLFQAGHQPDPIAVAAWCERPDVPRSASA
jgi:hypothetical protein